MSIQRGYIARADHFTIIPNDWMRDPNLSYRAKGLLAHLMTHQIGWSVSTEALMRCGTEGRDAIRTAIRELETAGYLARKQRRDDRGKLESMEYTLIDPGETPQTGNPQETMPDPADSPATDYPSTGNPTTGNPHPKKTNSKEDHLEEDQSSSSAEPAAPLRDDVERMLDYFDHRIEQIGVRRKPNRTKTNRDAARLMLDLDCYEPAEIRQVIDWATADSFWGPNIGSVKKLREKYPQLRARMSGTGQFAPRDTKQNRNLAILDAAEQRWAAEENNHHRMKELL